MSKCGKDRNKTHWQRFHLDPLGITPITGSYFYENREHTIIYLCILRH